MGALLNAQERYEESEPLGRESVETGEEVLGADHWRVAGARSLLGQAIAGQERYEEAEPLLLEGHAGLDAALPAGRKPQKLPPAIERLVRLYEAWGKPDKAAEWRAKLSEPDEEEIPTASQEGPDS